MLFKTIYCSLHNRRFMSQARRTRGILSEARNKREAQDEGRRKIKRLLPVHSSGCFAHASSINQLERNVHVVTWEESEQWTGNRRSSPRLALRAKRRVRLAWAIKRLLCRLLYWGIGNVFCRLLLRMDMDWNLKKLGQLFQVFILSLQKSAKWSWLVLPDEICLISSP